LRELTPSPSSESAGGTTKPPAHPENGDGVRSRNVGKIYILTWLSAQENFIDYFNMSVTFTCDIKVNYRGADKSLARPVRKKTTATENFDVHISYLLP